MQRIGTVSRTAQGLALVRWEEDAEPPAIGTELVDETLTSVGRVVDVFGPVSRPFLAVSPTSDGTPATLVGTKLYAR
jgi:RNA-binding protein